MLPHHAGRIVCHLKKGGIPWDSSCHLQKWKALLIPEGTADHAEQIEKPAQTEKAQSKGIENTGTVLPHIKSVCTQKAQKNAEHQCRFLILNLAGSRLGLGYRRRFKPDGIGGGCIGFQRKAATSAIIGIIGIFFSAVGTQHGNFSLNKLYLPL